MFAKALTVVLVFLSITAVTAKVIEAYDSTLKALLNNGKYTVLDIYAPWCGHCKRLEPVFDELSELFSKDEDKVQFIKIDGDSNRIAAKKFQVEYFPTVKFLNPGQYKNKEIGEDMEARDLDDLAKLVREKTGIQVQKPKEKVSQVVSLNDGNFDQLIEGKNALVAFTASWCGHCKTLKPEFEKLADLHKRDGESLVIGLVDCTGEATSVLASKYDVKAYPTVLYFSKDRADNTEFEAYSLGRTLGAFTNFLNGKAASFRNELGRLNPLAGRVTNIDKLISEQTELTADKITELAGSAKDSAALYIRYSAKVAEKGQEYVQKELARLGKLISSDKISEEKLDELQTKFNVLGAFNVGDKVKEDL